MSEVKNFAANPKAFLDKLQKEGSVTQQLQRLEQLQQTLSVFVPALQQEQQQQQQQEQQQDQDQDQQQQQQQQQQGDEEEEEETGGIIEAISPTITSCIRLSVLLFNDLFRIQILQLLSAFPIDQTTAAGVPFWSPPKRPPSPILFKPSEPLHFDFVLSATKLFAHAFVRKSRV
ncbi:hypothetical protein EBH_0082140 [Eimeria brunetti]|uniref:Ubiquitin-activating enzyme SCCH domain-containing protein n=1 Tax=Eimeria brunetti TaxID=51314 RepID=U6LIR1_9EIME|nr:hypothetical protein EBH_0082140 [Eimeria brunetti]